MFSVQPINLLGPVHLEKISPLFESYSHRIHGTIVYLPTWMDDSLWETYIGKYIPYMDAMGIETVVLFDLLERKFQKNIFRSPNDDIDQL